MIAFGSLLLAGLWLTADAQAAQPDPRNFKRDTPAVAPEGRKTGPGMGRVSRESLAIAACEARARTQGDAKYGNLRLAGYRTFLITGTITPKAGRRRAAKSLSFRCTVRGEGEILEFSTAPQRR